MKKPVFSTLSAPRTKRPYTPFPRSRVSWSSGTGRISAADAHAVTARASIASFSLGWIVHGEYLLYLSSCQTQNRDVWFRPSEKNLPAVYSQRTCSSITRTSASSPACSSGPNRPFTGLSISSTAATCPSAWIGITISDSDAPSQAICPGN